MDEETITKLQLERDRVEVVKKYEQEQTLKSFYAQVKEKQVKQNKIKTTIKIIVISFILLMTLMVAHLDSISKWESKSIQWFLKYPKSFENPFNLKQQF